MNPIDEGDPSPLLEMKGIVKAFPGVKALKGASFDLRAGEVHALMGENGAGKSTLMKILAGAQPRDSGLILLEGRPVEIPSPAAARALGIGVVHQEMSLAPDLTAAQNMYLGREPRGIFGLTDERALNAKAQAVFDSIHQPLNPRALVGGLSIARQQMVEIAKALTYDSRILILDEPTAALSDREVEELFAVIARLKAEGTGIVYISHKMDEIRRISDRVTVMRDGETVGVVPAAETPMKSIVAMMVGRELPEMEKPAAPNLAAGPPALEVVGLDRPPEIRDVSFSVRKGEILGFAGLMGAGRTEVARAIFGADPLRRGRILRDGDPVRIRSPQDAVRAGIGYLSEDRKHFGLALGMDLRANIGLASLGRFRGRSGVMRDAALAEAAQTQIRKLAVKTPSDRQEARLLSGGNQQKIVIGKWLLRDCEVLIFDEPTRGVDVGAKAEIHRLLEDLAAQGRALIVISSELPEILRVSHRIAVMCEGRLAGILPGGASQEEILSLATRQAPPASAFSDAALSDAPSDEGAAA